MSAVEDSGGEQMSEVKGHQSSKLSSLLMSSVLAAMLSVILYGLDAYVDLDVPVIEELPKRLLYAARVHGFGTIPIVVAIVCSLLSSTFQDSVIQSSAQLGLLTVVDITLLSFEDSYSKLMLLCVSIWTVGRFISLASRFFVRIRTVAEVISLFPLLVMVALTLNSLWQHGLMYDLEQFNKAEEEPEKTKGYFF